MKKFLERYPIFLVLLPAFVVIHLEKELRGVINYKLVYDKIIIIFLVPLVVYGVFYLIFRSVKKSAMMSFAFLVFFYFTGDIKNWINQKLPDSIWQSYSFLIPILLLILLLIFIMLRKMSYKISKAFFIINAALLLFIIADLTQILLSGHKGKFKIVTETQNKYPPCDTCSKPDIYYIVFDAYSSSELLQNLYGYSNLHLEDELKDKGFIIIPKSRSNYNYTAFSVGSTLSLNYIEKVDTIHRTLDRTYLQALKLVYNNRLVPFLSDNGYRIFNHSLFNIKSFPTTLKDFDPWGIRETYDQYNLFFKITQDIGHMFPGRLKEFLIRNPYYVNSPENRNRLDSTVYHNLVQSAKVKSNEPKFIYAHFLNPHPPFFYDSLGNILPPNAYGKEGYIHQVASVNRIIEKITDNILNNAQRPLVIILQADHGYSYIPAPKKPVMFSNLNAIYFANRDYKQFSDSVTNVNTFRIVLNAFFKTRYEMLPDKFYYLLH
jgi:sulfatase-like protein